ncbi:MAG: type II secretion system protein [Kiritimatiellaeota bacterium]|nr:type II secretion system protein [Kiritimatiellota bacterium]
MNNKPRTKNDQAPPERYAQASERRTVSGLPRRPAAGQVATWLPTWRAAFTLIELLVVIVVIAILMGITLPVSKYAIARAKAARQEVMLAKIRSALDDYRAAYGEYPITPITNTTGARPINYDDAIRHYPNNYPTRCYYTTNSPFTNVNLTSSTGAVENIDGLLVDYCLTYPLMLKQSDKGARPFYAFPDVTVISLVYRRWGEMVDGKRTDEWKQTIRRKGHGKKDLLGLVGAQVNRPKAIDPVSLKQWKYECYDGTSYTIKTNTF